MSALDAQAISIVAVVSERVLSLQAGAQRNSSLSESNLETAEAKVTSETLLSQNDLLRQQLSLDRETREDADRQSGRLECGGGIVSPEIFRAAIADGSARAWSRSSKDRAKLEQRLLKAVSDLQLMQKEQDAYREQLLQLSETMLRYVKTTPSGDAAGADGSGSAIAQRRTSCLARRRETSPDEAARRPDGRQGHQREGGVVAGGGQFGAKQGVKIGMPLRVVRSGQNDRDLRVVDVREKICGAVIQEMDSEKEKIKVGDRLQVDARQNVSLK